MAAVYIELLTVLCQCIAAVYMELLIVLRQCMAALYMDLLKILSLCMTAVCMEMLTCQWFFICLRFGVHIDIPVIEFRWDSSDILCHRIGL
jgi:hypothetical protein